MVKALTFKGDKKSKKRKRPTPSTDPSDPSDPSTALIESHTPSSTPAVTSDDSWTSAEHPSDMTGPLLLVLPSTPATALSSDPSGTIFPIAIENMIDDNPSTAEPHDVRQVWVASRIAGTDTIALKGHHGRYLTAERDGSLSARTEAIGPAEGFVVVLASRETPGLFALQTVREGFVGTERTDTDGGRIRCDEEAISFATTLRVRMQARFKPKIRKGKEEMERQRIGRKEIEEVVGRKVTDEEARRLKRARREGDFYEQVLGLKAKGRSDKYA